MERFLKKYKINHSNIETFFGKIDNICISKKNELDIYLLDDYSNEKIKDLFLASIHWLSHNSLYFVKGKVICCDKNFIIQKKFNLQLSVKNINS
ncbi:MAG: hypothetical protein QM536_04590 [Chitinophagaceae bacterium]|nr:hypothetical protein [Chitinophagaceae bacterium]